ncbi:hypothetical protein [Legionella sp. WA2024007413]
MTNNGSISPEDIIPDGVDNISINGTLVRKGTVAAFLANAKVLEHQYSTEIQKNEAIKTMKELAPAIIATGLHQHVVFKNKEVEQILIDAE